VDAQEGAELINEFLPREPAARARVIAARDEFLRDSESKKHDRR